MNSERLDVDLKALAADVAALRKQAFADLGDDDYAHLRKVERWGRACTSLGYGTAWLAINPVSMLLIAVGIFVRWAGVAHSVSHKGYDRIAGVPTHHTSGGFAQGLRRFTQWIDWIVPAAWHHEHDILHHSRLGEGADPDLVERNVDWLRGLRAPTAAKYAIVGVLASVWKPAYYAPTTIKELRYEKDRRAGLNPLRETIGGWRQWTPVSPQGRALWGTSFLPYVGFRFVLVPALFAPLGMGAVLNVLACSVGAELFTNLWSFVMIVPNHAGEDLPRFDGTVSGRGDFYLRQIVGSVNYRSSGFATDFLQGWLNYQIEHHLLPDLPLSQYPKIAPRVQAICAKHGIPYQEESVFVRLKKTVDVMIGTATMPVWSNAATVVGPAAELVVAATEGVVEAPAV